ncbi:UPF0236 family transposase-like protein [Arundinibacter roseus]|uniref:ISKra4 family transposase n=1 Tax=Arundinibacter roseus TaxID=2070510 RepID=A0A4R4JXF5_9BACT|nr:UPF0236 family protein [Arundinibacter roseus]TDB59557.1 hypothetical protein EZE20_22425 [Arundinibacter roseus]
MQHNFAVSPLLQSHMLEFSSDLPFARGSQLLNTALPHADIGASQCQRLTEYFGTLPEVEDALTTPGFDFMQSDPTTCDAPSVLYVETDGGHIRTDEGFRETKVGRLFGAHQLVKKSSDYEGITLRMALEKSDYIAQLGSSTEFTARFDELIANHRSQTPNLQLVAISDGAEWIARWLANKHADAVVILDFYHATEHLADFAKAVFNDDRACSNWIESCSKLLVGGKLDQVILAILHKKNTCKNRAIRKQADRLIRYYEHNRYRMKYHEYRAAGYCIGSGAIESAISTVVQQRCKLVGQRWTKGLTAVLNIRAIFKSHKRIHVRQVIALKMGIRKFA